MEVVSMARPRRADVGEPLEATLANGGPEAPASAPDATGGRGRARKPHLALPTSKTTTERQLETATILLHGPPGIGKSTLASQFPDFVFFDCAGELEGLAVYKIPVADWDEFREAAANLKEDQEQGDGRRFKGAVIDTADALATYVRNASNIKQGISHESKADWGAGWDAVKTEFVPRMAALSAMPSLGVIWISHSKTVEIKERSASYDRWVPDLPGVIGGPLTKNADIVLFVDWNDDEERVIYSKPSRYHEAKERGIEPMLPEQIVWPLGTDGYQVLKSAWGKVE